MKIRLTTEKGMTLLEVLAVSTLSVLLFGLIFSILMNSINHQNKEMDETTQLTDVTYLLKVVTKDVRNSTKLETNNQTMRLKSGTDYITYEFTNNTILRNGQPLGADITYFSLSNNGSGGVTVEIQTPAQQEVTIIYFRKAE
ncbi:hypothetical protein SAMN05880501_101719 [Ureibacillus xyleni]|uniref:Prepilin-type N-terminal cleavage/methylation domain-containing protein n=1 Tax=Ureibacillus xyleni TaxID=614648 RepID=A0A285RN98_9BACL|nr:type II secretion system protein [Ureibacillus xyleni]SOB93912.1 hypothetical protein SAMN05880501_101719 [Ureibacillus xyleni]